MKKQNKNKQKHYRSLQIFANNLWPRSLILIGLMGAGKSTIGHMLSKKLHMPFLDSDEIIAQNMQMSIQDIFAQKGEAEFRRIEEITLLQLLDKTNHIISTGGGAFMNEKIREKSLKNHLTIWLKADIEFLLQRVCLRSHQQRPLLKVEDPRAVLERLIIERYPIYQKAHICIKNEEQEKKELCDKLILTLERYLSNQRKILSKSSL